MSLGLPSIFGKRRIAPTAYLTHPDCVLHSMGTYHPECPDRLAAIQDALMKAGLWDHLKHVEAPAASMHELERVHPHAYVEALRKLSPQQGIVHLDPDTAMAPHTWQAALHAAGAVVKATDLVVDGEVRNAFCAVRPPGHHAEIEKAMGFCFFNNVAVGVRHALSRQGIRKVAVVDFDVHHGNGTEDIFKADDKVLMVSIFQHPFYPYSGEHPLGINMHNTPMRAGSGSAAFRAVVEKLWLPELDRFKPDIIFISAGFDAHRDDDMASMALCDDDYGWVTERLMDVADRHCDDRIVSSLEGGYCLSALGRSATAHIRTLAGL
ncbi:histone deacetylase family protein [Parachitinimonas caeni]|uniref:Histone deacetylase family protein n=1 Tax=Parachitinimonas caeni TaxID=3031301 RepID=A0ABT7DU97_9NEIS|nr:histone deacetylase family protein [Parachitinimonas caeni]MDK2123637.1 histone deacetylase family protein [Parachitinimonas caeni]